MKMETASVRSMPLNDEIWVHAGDVSKLIQRWAVATSDKRGHQIFSWLAGVFDQIAAGKLEVSVAQDQSLAPTTEELQQDLIVLRSELQEGG